MKYYYFFIILLSIITVTACNEGNSSEKKEEQSNQQRTPEEDQQILDERLAYTNRIWDSLDGILNQEDLISEYRDSIKALYKRNRYKYEEIFKDFIRENPASEISITNLNGLKFTWGKETTKDLFEGMSYSIKESEKGVMVANYLEYYNEPQINDPYTDFELKNLDGEEIKLSDNLEEYTLLDFWATYCKYCRENHKELIKIYDKFNERGFTIIGISIDDDMEKLKRAVSKDELPWINLILPDGRESKVHHQYGVFKTPTYFLIGPDGKIIAKDIRHAELEKLLSRNI